MILSYFKIEIQAKRPIWGRWALKGYVAQFQAKSTSYQNRKIPLVEFISYDCNVSSIKREGISNYE